MVPPSDASLLRASRLLSGLAVLLAVAAAVMLLTPVPLADAFFAGWVLVSVALALGGGVGAWTNRRASSGWPPSC